MKKDNMKEFLEKIKNSQLGEILDNLFLGFFYFFPKFVSYLMIPTIIFCLMKFIGIAWVTESFLITFTLWMLPITALGIFWFIYRTVK